MSLRSLRQARRGSLASVFAGGIGMNGLTLALSVVSGVLAARALSPTGRGALAAILIAPNVAPFLFSLGVQRAASYHLARRPEDGGRILVAWSAMLVPASVIAVVVLEVLVPVLLRAQSHETQHLARLWMLTAVLALYGRLANGILLGTHRFGTYYLSGFAQPVVLTGGYIGLWATGHLTLQLALVVNVAAGLLSLGIAALVILRNNAPARPTAALAKESLWYGVRSQGGEIGGSVNARLDALVIPSLVGSAQVGYYSVASNVSWIVFIAAATVSTVVLPAAARRGSGNVPAIVASLYFTLTSAVVLGGLLALTAPVLVPLLYGSSFRPALLPLEILLVGTVVYAAAAVLESGLGALNAPWLASVAQLLGAVITVGGLLIVLPRGGGIVGAAIVSTIAYTSTFLVALVLFKRTARVPWIALLPTRRHLDELLAGSQRSRPEQLVPQSFRDDVARQPGGYGARRRLGLPSVHLRTALVGVLAVAALSIGVGALVPESSPADLGTFEPWTLWWLLLGACVLVLVRNSVGLFRASAPKTHRVASSVVALGTIAAVIFPGAQLLTGASTLRLGPYGLAVPDLDAALAAAFAIFLLAIVGLWLGESFGLGGRIRPKSRRVDSPWVYAALVAIALATRFVAGSVSVADRASQGRGLQSLLGWGIPLAVAIGLLNRHWGSRRLAALSVLLTGYQLFGGTSRSPLFLIGIAVSLRALTSAQRSRRSLRSIAALVLVGCMAVVLAIGFSAWRHQVTVGEPASLTSSLVAAAKNPFANFTARTQLDSLEGSMLSMQVDRSSVGASWTDPSKAVINFVPRKLWPNKPEWLGPRVTHQYLNLGGNAGVFLSGPGYVYILYGGAVGVLIAFVVLGVLSRRLYGRMEIASVGALLLTYFWMRFFFGGDAYDLFTVLGLSMLVVLARVAARIARVLPAARGIPALSQVSVRS